MWKNNCCLRTVNRDDKNINSKAIGAPFSSLATVEFKSWEENDCPLCKKGIPINISVGKGKEYLQNRK